MNTNTADYYDKTITFYEVIKPRYNGMNVSTQAHPVCPLHTKSDNVL